MSALNSVTQKWIVIGIKAAVAALALIPALRKPQRNDLLRGPKQTESPFRSMPSQFSLVFMTSNDRANVGIELEYGLANSYFVDKDKIQSLARYYRAYAVAIHCNDELHQTQGPLSRQQVINQIADALREIDVKIIPDVRAC